MATLYKGKYKHGTATAYVQGCRCDECRAANAARRRRQKQSKGEPVGAKRGPRSPSVQTVPMKLLLRELDRRTEKMKALARKRKNLLARAERINRKMAALGGVPVKTLRRKVKAEA